MAWQKIRKNFDLQEESKTASVKRCAAYNGETENFQGNLRS